MSYSIRVVGRDKEKLKEAVRAQQCKDEVNSPHNGIPAWVADHLCSEIDRIRQYQYADRVYGLELYASGSFHEQGNNHQMTVNVVQIVE